MCQASDALRAVRPANEPLPRHAWRSAARTASSATGADCDRARRCSSARLAEENPKSTRCRVLQRDRRRRRGVHRRLRRGRSPADVARRHRDQPRLRPHPADRQGDLPHPPPRRPHRGLAQLLHGELAAARVDVYGPGPGRPPHPVVSTRRRRAADLPRRAHTRNASGARPHAPGLRLQHQPPCRR